MLPAVNATLTAIAAVGSSGDGYDDPTGGAPRWSGNLGIWVAEEILEEIEGGELNEVLRTRLELPYTVGKIVKRGDRVTYVYEDQPVTRTAGTISHAKLVGRVRVLLEDA